MTFWRHPCLGPIEVMPENMRPKKVWKHFYEPREHWERLCGLDVAMMRAETEAVLDIQRDNSNCEEIPHVDGRRWRQVKMLVQRHHDEGYGEVYLREMASPDTEWSSPVSNGDGHLRAKALTPNSVFLSVQLVEAQHSWIVTAFRPHPGLKNVEYSEADLRREAIDYFRRQTGMEIKNIVAHTVEELRRVSANPPESVRDLWWLASAVGYGRALAEHDEVQAVLPRAEKLLNQTSSALLKDFKDGLDWEGAIEKISSALQDDYPDELEHALAVSEKLLAIGDAIGAAEEVETFLEEAEELLGWLPANWSHLVEEARERGALFGMSTFAGRLWSNVEVAGLSAAIQDAAPDRQPEAQYVDQLIPDKSWLERISTSIERINAAAGEVGDEVITWARGSLNTVDLAAPAMGDSGKPKREWKIRGEPISNAPHYRLFAVDDDEPAGDEITEFFTPEDGELWWMDKPVLIVLFASEKPIPEDNLATLLEYAAERDDIFVYARKLNPPR